MRKHPAKTTTQAFMAGHRPWWHARSRLRDLRENARALSARRGSSLLLAAVSIAAPIAWASAQANQMTVSGAIGRFPFRACRTRRFLTALATALTISVCCLACAGFGVAHAGTWTLVSCTQPGGQSAPIEGWSSSATGPLGPYSGVANTCAGGGSISAMSSGEATQTPYSGPEWVFTTPSGSTIAGGKLVAALTAAHGQSWLGTPQATYDAADVLVNCQYNLSCGSTGASGTYTITKAGGTHIYAIAECVGPYEGATSCPAVGGVDASVAVHAADITLFNDATPAASNIAGTLLAGAARGTAELTLTATDTQGPGVYSVTVEADGSVLYNSTPDDNGGRCLPIGSSEGTLMFLHLQPCKQQESVAMPVDTTSLPDGTHSLKITLTDAAGNTSIVYDATVSTQNAPANSSPPTLLTPGAVTVGSLVSARPGSWSAPAGAGAISYGYQWQDCNAEGGACAPIAGAQSASYTPAPSDVGHTLRVIVTAADNDGQATATSAASAVVASAQSSLGAAPGPGSPLVSRTASAVAGIAGAGTANGVLATARAVIYLGVGHRIARTYAERAFQLPGRLVNAQGQPIGDATVQVLQRTGSGLRPIAQATTGERGAFVAHVPAGGSRQIEVAYRAFANQPGYAATANLEEIVGAGVQLQVSPRRTGSTGTIRLSGRVLGAVPRRGVIVDLLVHYRGRWVPFRTPRTNAHGRFDVLYQFQGAVGRFPLQAAVPGGQASFAYARGHSRIVDVATR
jgi:hypothetical protein